MIFPIRQFFLTKYKIMKMNQIIFPLVLALAATLATTGCKKGQPKTTPLPGSRAPIVSDTSNGGTRSGSDPSLGSGGSRRLSLLDVPTKQVKDVSRISGSNSQPSWAK